MKNTVLIKNQRLVITGKGQAQFTAEADIRLKSKRVAFTSEKFGEFAIGDVVTADFELDPATGNRKMVDKPRLTGLTAGTALHEEIMATKPSARTAGFYLSPEVRLAFSTAKKMSDRGKTVKMMMIGPSGYGKTQTPKEFAAAIGAAFYRMNCAAVRDPEEWFGYREAVDGSTVFVKSELMKLLEAGNLVLVLDEFNRVEPWLHNSLFPMLDDDGATVIHDELFTIGQGVYVVATINHGFEYTGTFEPDLALMNRFDLVLEVGPLPSKEEVKVLMERTGVAKADAESIVGVAADLRGIKVNCSTRSTIIVATMVAAGMSLREAYENGVVRRIFEEDGMAGKRKAAMDRVNASLGPLKPRALAYDVFEAESADAVADKILADALAGIAGKAVTLRMISENEANKIGMLKYIRKALDLSLFDGKSMVEHSGEGPTKWFWSTVSATVDLDEVAAEAKKLGFELEVRE